MAAMTFYDAMVIVDNNEKVHMTSLRDNEGILEDALEQIVPEQLENIRDAYRNELNKAQTTEAENDAYYIFERRFRKLIQENWDAIYAIVADDLK